MGHVHRWNTTLGYSGMGEGELGTAAAFNGSLSPGQPGEMPGQKQRFSKSLFQPE